MNSYKNANMWQKSAIQQQLEYNSLIESLKSNINNLMESYEINGNIFGIVNDCPSEVNNGYFVIESIHESLQDAIKEVFGKDKFIRVLENKVFQIGEIYRNYSECPSDKTIIDVEQQTEVIR